MQPDDLALVMRMLVEIDDAIDFCRGYDRRRFIADRRTRKSVGASVQNVGESARYLSDEFKLEHPEIDWPKVVGMRHRIVHNYWDVNYQVVWSVVHNELPPLRDALAPLGEE
jgi:uncharacterized protein with HEPN domain